MIAIAKRGRKNRGLLALENIDKSAIAEVVKLSSIIDLGNIYNWAISNANIDTARDLRLTDIKKYWRCTSQI